VKLATIQDKQVAKLWGMAVYNMIGIASSVKMWPAMTNGRITMAANFTGFTVFDSASFNTY
jgi:hypothetical protein